MTNLLVNDGSQVSRYQTSRLLLLMLSQILREIANY